MLRAQFIAVLSCGIKVAQHGEKEEGPFFFVGLAHSTAPRGPKRAAKRHRTTHSRGKCGKQANHTGKTKEGFVFLDKDLHAAEKMIKND